MDHPRLQSPRRAHFSGHESDRHPGIDQALMRAAMADQAALQEELRQAAPTQAISRPKSPNSPFQPGYSLAASQSHGFTNGRAQMAMSVSPLHVHRQLAPSRSMTESPLRQNSDPIEPPSGRQAQFCLPGEEEEGEERMGEGHSDIQAPSSWASCRDRRPTSAIVPPFSYVDEYEGSDSGQHGPSLGSNALLGSKRPSLHLQRNNRPSPLQLHGQPTHAGFSRPPPAAYHDSRSVSGGFPFPLRDPSQGVRGSNGSTSSIHGSTPYIQHYDPLSSPSMVQPYTPRIASNCSMKSNNLKPALVRHDQSYQNLTCELGIAGTGEEDEHREAHRGGIRGALAGLMGRVSANDFSSTKDKEAERDTKEISSRASRQRSSSAHSTGSTAVGSRRESDSSILETAPSLSYLNNRRKSMAFILGEDDQPLEADDPRLSGAGRKSVDCRRQYDFLESRRASYTSEHCDADIKPRRRTRSFASIVAPLKELGNGGEKPSKQKNNHSSLHAHMAERQKLILKLARALMLFGAPSHRVESQLNALSQVLAVDGQYIHFPGIVIASFGDIDKHTSECHFVKSKTDLALGHLTDVHRIYKGVITDKLTVEQATKDLNRLLKAKPEWSILSRVAFNAIRCGIMAPMSFGGSFVDIFIAGAFGAGLTFTQLYFAGNNPMFSNVFEITAAIVISFLARVLSTQSVFCYQAVASAGLILVLPGYIILCGSLELASKNMIAGSVRMVYAIIYSLFLGFGVAIGSDLYFVFDPKARKSIWLPLDTQTAVQGSFTFANETLPHWSGQFTFSNGTKNALNVGSINCERLPDWPWYRQQVNPLWNILFVPLFSFLACFSLLHPFKSREVPVSVIIACIGFVTNVLANHYIFDRSDVVSAIGSFVIGLLGNAYSRLYDATAFTAMTVAILFLVPSGMAMAGGLAMTYKGSDGDIYSNGLSIGLRMVQVSIGITTGLFASALLVYMFGNKRKNAQLFAF